MWHSKLQNPDPDPTLFSNAGSGSVYNEYGSATLLATLTTMHEKLLLWPCTKSFPPESFTPRGKNIKF